MATITGAGIPSVVGAKLFLSFFQFFQASLFVGVADGIATHLSTTGVPSEIFRQIICIAYRGLQPWRYLLGVQASVGSGTADLVTTATSATADDDLDLLLCIGRSLGSNAAYPFATGTIVTGGVSGSDHWLVSEENRVSGSSAGWTIYAFDPGVPNRSLARMARCCLFHSGRGAYAFSAGSLAATRSGGPGPVTVAAAVSGLGAAASALHVASAAAAIAAVADPKRLAVATLAGSVSAKLRLFSPLDPAGAAFDAVTSAGWGGRADGATLVGSAGVNRGLAQLAAAVSSALAAASSASPRAGAGTATASGHLSDTPPAARLTVACAASVAATGARDLHFGPVDADWLTRAPRGRYVSRVSGRFINTAIEGRFIS